MQQEITTFKKRMNPPWIPETETYIRMTAQAEKPSEKLPGTTRKTV